MSIRLTNNASSLLTAPILAADTSITITPTDAALFPALSLPGDYFYCTLEDRRMVPNLREIVKVTSTSANTFTIARAQDGTLAANFFIGAIVSLRLTAAAIFDVRQEETARAMAAEAAEAATRATADATEAAARAAGDATEAAARAAAITAEQIARTNADTTETAARIAADNAEAIARAAGDAAEASARTIAINAETARAEAAEAALAGGTSSSNAAIAAETARAEAAEAALSAAIAAAAVAAVKSGEGGPLDGSGHYRVSFPVAYPTACTSFTATLAAGGLLGIILSAVADAAGADVYGCWPWGAPAPGTNFYWTATGN